jgi:translation elongation factor EF-1alpha
VFIGHVDAGKSTMGGQLLALTGMVSRMTNDQTVETEIDSDCLNAFTRLIDERWRSTRSEQYGKRIRHYCEIGAD